MVVFNLQKFWVFQFVNILSVLICSDILSGFTTSSLRPPPPLRFASFGKIFPCTVIRVDQTGRLFALVQFLIELFLDFARNCLQHYSYHFFFYFLFFSFHYDYIFFSV